MKHDSEMATVDQIRNGLIEKLLAIRNKAFLEALDKLVESSEKQEDPVVLSTEQKSMMKMSEDDLDNGRLISQEAMFKRNLEWLNGK